MKRTIYQCDLCKTESQEAKLIYSPKNGLNQAIVNLLRERFKLEDVCSCCFDKVNEGCAKLVNELLGKQDKK